MNTIRTIEAATLASIGVFCAAAVLNIALHGSNLMHAADDKAKAELTALQLPPVAVTAKRLTLAQKTNLRRNHAAG